MPEPIPQHNTPTDGGEGGKGFFAKHFEKHGTLWLIGIGAATLVVIVMVARRNSAAAQAAQVGSMPTGYDTSGTAGLPGSQADANYQQLQYSENTNTALLQSILTALQGQPPAGTPTGGTGGTTGTGTPPSQQPPGSTGGQNTPNSTYGKPPSNPWTPWVTSANPGFLSNIWTGEHFLYEGVWTTIGAGGGGRVWEVPGQLTAAQFNATPIGPGQKQLLYNRPH